MHPYHKFYLMIIAGGLALLPEVVSAHNIQNVFHLMEHIKGWIIDIVPVAIGVILIVIMWHIGQFVLHADDEGEREKHKQFIIWAVVAIFGVVAFWGISYAILGSFFNAGDARLGTPGYVDKNGVLLP